MKQLALVLGSIALASACKKVDKTDCDAYSEHIASLNPGISDSRRGSVKEVARAMCEKGEVTGDEARCAIGATSLDGLAECHASGGKQANHGGVGVKMTPPGPRARRDGFSVTVPVGWTENKSMQGMLQLTDDKRQTIMVARTPAASMGSSDVWVTSDERCRAHAEEASKGVQMSVTSAKLVDASLGKNCHQEMKGASGSSISNTVIGSFGALSVMCMSNDTNASDGALAPTCAAVLSSATLE